jgi:hypothetical protein
MGQKLCRENCCTSPDEPNKEIHELPILEFGAKELSGTNDCPSAASTLAQVQVILDTDIKQQEQTQSTANAEDCEALRRRACEALFRLDQDTQDASETLLAPPSTVPVTTSEDAPVTAAAPKVAAQTDPPPGHGLFWVLVTAMHDGGQKVLCLRNCVNLDTEMGFRYVKLSRAKGGAYTRTNVKINQGDSFGQWCRISDSAQRHLLANFKDISSVKGKAIKTGLPPTQDVERALPKEKPIADEDRDVLYFEDLQDRLPLGLEKSFRISCFELEGEPGKVGPTLKKKYSQIGSLPFGLPWSVEEFRSRPLSGAKHASGFVPAINGQQFCIGSECTFVWVRFDVGDLSTFEHNLEGVPVCKDGQKGVIFPVTHLWVDLTDSFSLEWFLGKKCVARKKMSLWFIPGAVLRGVVSFGFRRLTETKFEDDESDKEYEKIKGA